MKSSKPNIQSFALSAIMLTIFLGFFISQSNAQSVGIASAAITPDASSLLELRSSSKGLLIPRLTTTERDAISSPATGLQIYNTTTNKFNYYNGSAWTVLFAGSSVVNTITGTSNRISIGGTSSDPTIDISSSYVGQSSITTLGTIGTGVWNGTLIDPTYGGTGINNGTKTITLGGNLVTSGAYATTLTVTGTTNATIPSGTNTLYSTKSASITSSQLLTSLSDATGTGAAVFGSTPTLATPVINGLPTGTGVASAATASTLVARDANANTRINNNINGYSTTVTAAGTTTLTVGSSRLQFFTGSSTQTMKLPVTSTLVTGQQFQVTNLSSGNVTVQSSGGNTVQVQAASSVAIYTCIGTTQTDATDWNVQYIGGSNTGDQTMSITGDVTAAGSTGVLSATVTKINGTSLAGLATGILKNSTSTGVPSIAVASDFPVLNQNTTGSAATLTTARNIYGNSFNGSADLNQIIASTYGGTGNGFTKFSGPATSEKTFTLPNASATILTDNAAVTAAQGGTGVTSYT
ncbi:MAG TPA: hypothetical protein VKH37_09030, partial [Ferruginibacter sp.]|nr:hypothetical protein [Ferruginibacter sp.]